MISTFRRATDLPTPLPNHSKIFSSAMLCALALPITLSGCASFSSDGGLSQVSALTQERTGQTMSIDRSEVGMRATQATVDQLLAQSLTAESAVRIALLNNQRLQSALADLGVAEAEAVQGGRLRNPGLSFSRLRGGQDVEIERSVMVDIVGLLSLPWRSRIARGQFELAQLQTAAEAVRLAADARRAYFNAVAAAQSVEYMIQVKASAEAGAVLAKNMAKVGNFSKLDYARQQMFYADATTQLARAMHNATTTREALSRELGMHGEQSAKTFQLPDRLPDLPASLPESGDIEALALRQRLDVQMARRDTEATANALGLSRATRLVNVLDAGYRNRSESGKARENGYAISLELPIFDWNSAGRKAEAQYMSAFHRTADMALRARSEVRENYSAYRTAYDIATHYRDEVVPLQKQISDEVLLRYNGMLSSVFELLADARTQATTVNAAIDAQRDFWTAETDLQLAINGIGAATSNVNAGNSRSIKSNSASLKPTSEH